MKKLIIIGIVVFVLVATAGISSRSKLTLEDEVIEIREEQVRKSLKLQKENDQKGYDKYTINEIGEK